MEVMQHNEYEQSTTSFFDSWRNVLRITSVRVIVQAVFLAMFVAFVLLTTFAQLEGQPALRNWVGKLLEIDPLISISTVLTTHALYRGLIWSLVILIPTLLLGRFFCNWICPLGTLQQLVAWLLGRFSTRDAVEANSYRQSQRIKYYILAGMLAAAVFGSLQIGLLDPLALVFRSFTAAILPAADLAAQAELSDVRIHQGAWLIGGLVFALLALTLVVPRWFCRVLCPLGALLGVFSRFAWWRIERDPVRCNGCNRCRLSCEGACDPHAELRTAECLVCFNCIEECPEGALGFSFFPPREHEVVGVDVPRRRVMLAAVAGVLFYPFVRTSGRSTRNFSAELVRPPGSVEELAFLSRCIKCDQCIRVCPTNVLQPAWFEGGLEGLWSPLLDFEVGHCQLHCVACGQVCPTGAIKPITVDQKLGLADYAQQGPIRIGTAHFDVGRCLPYSKNIPCVVCEEVCPTSPKAIYTQPELRPVRDGRRVVAVATSNTVTVGAPVASGRGVETSEASPAGPRKGDDTTRFYLTVRHADGTRETHRVIKSDGDTFTIEGVFLRHPPVGGEIALEMELAVPRIDMNLCIGCGICEQKCPVVGDRRAVYVTADGETRSANRPEADRNRSVRLPT